LANTHRAYIMVDSAMFTDRMGKEYVKDFETPRHKLIASGSQEFCAARLVEYGHKHGLDGVKAGVVRCDTDGNPWAREWPEV